MAKCKLKPQLRNNFLYSRPYALSGIIFVLLFFLGSIGGSVKSGFVLAFLFTLCVFIFSFLLYKNTKTIEAKGYETIEIDTKERLIKFDNNVRINTDDIKQVDIIDSPVPWVLQKFDKFNPIINVTLVFKLENGDSINFQAQNKIHYKKIIELLSKSNVKLGEVTKIEEDKNNSSNKSFASIAFAIILIAMMGLKMFKHILEFIKGIM